MVKSKMTKFSEMAQMDFLFQPSYRELTEAPFPLKGEWGDKFFKNNNPIVLELGCGKGEYTVEMAKRSPNKNFIGVDIKGARMWTGANHALENSIGNVAFIRTNIELLSSFFGSKEVSEIWITFPDPQMKRWRRRLTSTRFQELYREFLKDDGLINLKTDSGFLYNYTVAMLEENSFPVAVNDNDIYGHELVNPLLDIKTYYEQQWLDRGKTIKYLSWGLHANEFVEPDVEIEFDDYRSYGR